VWERAKRLGLVGVVACAAGLVAYGAGLTTTEAVLIAVLVFLLGRPGPDSLRPGWRRLGPPTSPDPEPDVATERPRVPVGVGPGPGGGGGR
jgi:hypothetical protein